MKEIDIWIDTINHLDVLIPNCGFTLSEFYISIHGFKSKPRDPLISIISHSRCIEASELIGDLIDFEYQTDKERENQLNIFIEADWSTGKKDKPQSYPISVAIPALSKIRRHLPSINDKNTENWKKLITKINDYLEILESSIKKLGTEDPEKIFEEPLFHTMFLYRIRRALFFTEKFWLDDLKKFRNEKDDKDGVLEQITRMKSDLDNYIEKKLYYFLSICSAIPNNEDDALQLGYLIYTLRKYSKFENDVIIEYGIKLVLKTLFTSENFPRMQVVYRNSNLNISSSPLELLTLFAKLPMIRRRFLDYWQYYNRAFNWIIETQRDNLFPDPKAPGWMAEPWRGVKEPEAWINVSIIDFLFIYRQILGDVTCSCLLTEFSAKTNKPKFEWEVIFDYEGYKKILDDNFININKSVEGKFDKASLILFGPPGSAKTSIARAIAWELKLPFIELLPHHFAEGGTDNVIKRAKDIFRKLFVMKRCVVFFDEIDELVTSRDIEHQKIGRFITTSVLPWFQELRNKGQVIFIVATNYVDNFDSAVKRPGRFDFVIPIGPPSEADRELFIKKRLRDIIDSKVIKTIIKELNNKIKSNLLEYKCSNDVIKRSEWSITIGEIQFLIEFILQKNRTKALQTNDVKEIIDLFFEKASKNPMISLQANENFVADSKQYRYPALYWK